MTRDKQQLEPTEVGALVYWGEGTEAPVKVVKRWDDYPTTYRYLLDNGVVADHSECWPVAATEVTK